MPASHSHVRISSAELAQLQCSVQALELPKKNAFPIRSSDSKENTFCADDTLSLNNSRDILPTSESKEEDEELAALLAFDREDPFFPDRPLNGFNHSFPEPPPLFTPENWRPESPPLILHRSMRDVFQGCAPPPSSSRPMSREVSLFQGLPNGWQYFTDYKAAEEACKEFVAAGRKANGSSQHLKPEVQRKRPRIPSIIAPLTSTNINAISAERDSDRSNSGTDRAQISKD
ncbi:hypothetical protein BT96DRAFT_920148, partial [Gymnopus androsaceus JB14]